MRNKVFKQRLEEWEFQVRYTDDEYLIANKNGNLIATVSKKVRKQINTDFVGWDELSDEKKDMLFDLFIRFASTPPEDREEEKKFYLEHRYFKCSNGDSRYFQIYEPDGKPWLNAMYSVMGYKKQFTLKEIEEIKIKFDTDLTDFELVEVEE